MSNLQIFIVQFAMSLVVYTLIAAWYIAPRLARIPLRNALIPIMLANALRAIGLVFIVPSVTDPALPEGFAVPAAYGDLITATLALVAAIALRAGWKGSIWFVWLVNLVGTADLSNALLHGIQVDISRFQLGSTWYIPTFLVPVYLVLHGLVFVMLVQRQAEYRPSGKQVPARFDDNQSVSGGNGN